MAADVALQLVVNGVMAGAVLAVPAIGFSTIYAVLRFTNFGVGGLATVGAYAGWVANARWGLPLAPSLGVAAGFAGVAGVACDEVALRRLRPAGGFAAAIASVALAIVLENAVRFVWGNDLLSYDTPLLRDWQLGPVRVGPQQAINAGWSLLVMAALFLFLRFTRAGKMMRAVADNPALADLKGIDPNLVARLATGAGMALAGFGGMLLGLDTGIDPLLGFRVMLSVFAAAVVGGLGSISGAVAGALLVGVGEELSLLVLDPAYRTAVGFAAILLVLWVRPRGLLGERAV
ncbi:MAG: branched-chain amino acid ABC transporter permease [Acetobacteraceae bacterium]|nr:branched-chain amino acid ABC transporter permease [Acetobacteraceae bacterium]